MDKQFYSQTIQVPAQCRSKRLRESGVDAKAQRLFRASISAATDVYTGGTEAWSTKPGATPDTAVIVDCGQWEAGREYLCQGYNYQYKRYETHDVWHYNCRWRCLLSGTQQEPGLNANEWQRMSGEPVYTIGSFPDVLYLNSPLDRQFTVIAKASLGGITTTITDFRDTADRTSPYQIYVIITSIIKSFDGETVFYRHMTVRYGDLQSDGSYTYPNAKSLVESIKTLGNNFVRLTIELYHDGELAATKDVQVRKAALTGVSFQYGTAITLDSLAESFVLNDTLSAKRPIGVQQAIVTYEDGTTESIYTPVADNTMVFRELATLSNASDPSSGSSTQKSEINTEVLVCGDVHNRDFYGIGELKSYTNNVAKFAIADSDVTTMLQGYEVSVIGTDDVVRAYVQEIGNGQAVITVMDDSGDGLRTPNFMITIKRHTKI